MRCTACRYFISFLYKLGQVSKKMLCFFSFVVRFRLVIRFYSHFFGLLVRFFPQHQVFLA